jgi:hypothetical protein
VAKTRRGKPASRAKGAKKKTPAKRTKKSLSLRKQAPAGLDLKKLQADIAKANDILTKRMQGVDPESPKGRKLTSSLSTINQWSLDIDGICADGEPCGPTMVIS